MILRGPVDKSLPQGHAGRTLLAAPADGGDNPPPMNCRPSCAACCIAPSISSPIPGMPDGKPAGVRCIQLDQALRCKIFGRPERPAVCGSLPPSEDMCGDSREQAMRWLGWMEEQTMPTSDPGGSDGVFQSPTN